MADVKVGDRVKRHVYYGMEGGTLLPPEKGRVVYIHPEGRFFTAEFTFAKGSFRDLVFSLASDLRCVFAVLNHCFLTVT